MLRFQTKLGKISYFRKCGGLTVRELVSGSNGLCSSSGCDIGVAKTQVAGQG